MKKQALITGAAKRIGKSISLGLAESGYDIALHYFTSEKEAQKTCEQITEIGRKCSIYRADLSKPSEAEKMFIKVLNDFPDLNILINSASTFHKGNLSASTVEEVNTNIAVHVTTPLSLIRILTQKRTSGTVINILDAKIAKNKYGYAGYYLGKKGLAELTRMAALEFAPDFRVNGIAPGFVLLPSDGSLTEADLPVRNPLKKKVDIESIINTVEFLIQNKDITGQIIFVDGGEHL
jgi:NAD(P)-dependent dehydrogenase (short-subunit alcohol dehydrogenase family)